MVEFEQAQSEDAAAFEALQATYVEPRERQGDGFDNLREPRIGAPPSAVEVALAARKTTTDRVSAFEFAHPLVAELVRAKKHRP